MTKENTQLWSAIKEFQLDDPYASLSFSDRLARENDWTLEYSLRVVLEYKRFMFLICSEGGPFTPSDEVDQAWHLHLLYTQSYWIEFCQNTLQQNIHHGPTKGGKVEQGKYANLYQATKDAYIKAFDFLPPTDIWPSNEQRFSNLRFTRVNRSKTWLIPKFNIRKLWKH